MQLSDLLTPDPADQLRFPAVVARDVLGVSKNPRTYVRHIEKGVFVRGRWVKLAAIRTGGSYQTTARAFRAFLAELNAPADGPAEVPAPRSPNRRQAASRAAEAELIRQGA